MKKLAISGYYGMRNFGDDVFAYVSSIAVRNLWRGIDPIVVSPPLRELDSRFAVPAFFKNQYCLPTLGGKALRVAALLRSACTSDMVLYCGGSLFAEPKPGRSLALRFSSNPPSAIGVSIGPFGNDEDKAGVKKLLDEFGYLCVRDHESLQLAETMKLDVVEGRDIAALLPKFMPLPTGIPSGGHITYIPCDGRAAGYKSPEAFERDFLLSLAHRPRGGDLTITILILNENPASLDLRMGRAVYDKLAGAGYKVAIQTYGELGIVGVVRQILDSRVVVSGRLHGAIVAYVYGVPFILHEYHRKCVDFLNDIGVQCALRDGPNGMLPPLDRILNGDFSTEMSVEKFQQMAELGFSGAPWGKE